MLSGDVYKRQMRERAIAHFKLLHIAKPSVLGTFSNGEHAVKEIVEQFASGKVVGCDGTIQRAFGRMC